MEAVVLGFHVNLAKGILWRQIELLLKYSLVRTTRTDASKKANRCHPQGNCEQNLLQIPTTTTLAVYISRKCANSENKSVPPNVCLWYLPRTLLRDFWFNKSSCFFFCYFSGVRCRHRECHPGLLSVQGGRPAIGFHRDGDVGKWLI